jgi:hypothetical protein
MTLGSVLAAAVWVVGKIETKTAVLGTNIEHLSASVLQFSAVMKTTGEQIAGIDNRVTRLEVQSNLERVR